jgi:hypothetical protein
MSLGRKNHRVDVPTPSTFDPGSTAGLSAGATVAIVANVARERSEHALHRRNLTRGGGLLLVGPTGIGKSSFSMQCMLLWPLERPAFGIAPAQPLTSLLIQAENDDGDLAEMRDGVVRGLALPQEQSDAATNRVFVINESAQSGEEFLDMIVAPALRAHRPDLVWIDPALAYLGGDSAAQSDVSAFLRNGLNPLLQEFRCGAVIIHHTNKVKNERAGADMTAACQGSGSAEWANWSRAVLFLQPTPVKTVFKLHAAKRGQRIDWHEADGTTRSFTKHIAHSNTGNEIFWRTATENEIISTYQGGEGRLVVDPRRALALLPDQGSMLKSTFEDRVRGAFGIGEKPARQLIKRMLADEDDFPDEEPIVHQWNIPRQGKKPAVHVSRTPQPEPAQALG